MATYKSQILHWRYHGRLRPWHHYTIGRLPQWLSYLDRVPGLRALARAALKRPWVNAVSALALGVDPIRQLPAPSPISLHRWWSQRPGRPAAGAVAASTVGPAPAATVTGEPPVMVFADSFSTHLAVEGAQAAVQLVTQAGYAVSVSPPGVCCGLTAITTGDLTRARRAAADLLRALRAHLMAGGVIVGLEPSCTAALRTDVPELALADQTLTGELADVAELLRSRTVFLSHLLANSPHWQPPDLTGVHVIAQPHCHQRATVGWDTDQRLLESAGATVTRVDSCCGMAGSFGMTSDHRDLSMAVADLSLRPALERRDQATVVVADGFSCQTQLATLGCERPVTLAQLLLRAAEQGPRPAR